MAKDTSFTIRLDEDLKKRMQAIAKSEDRTLSNWVLHSLKKEADKKLPVEPQCFFDGIFDK